MERAVLAGYVQHRDGGLYRVKAHGKSTVDGSEVVIYEHIYPFEQSIWVRPMAEWTVDRFKPVSLDERYKIEGIARATLQAQITEAKRARKG